MSRLVALGVSLGAVMAPAVALAQPANPSVAQGGEPIDEIFVTGRRLNLVGEAI